MRAPCRSAGFRIVAGEQATIALPILPTIAHIFLLTIVPLFHCNGWNHSWMMPLLGGTVVCCREVTAKAIYDAIADEGVTHFGGAPIVRIVQNQRSTFYCPACQQR